MRRSRTLNSLEKAINRATWLLKTAGLVVLVALVVITVADVFLRYTFGLPILGSYELISYLLAACVFCFVPFTAVMNGHISIDLLVRRFGQRAQDITDGITHALGLVFCVLLLYQTAVQARHLMSIGANSGLLRLPDFVFFFVIVLGTLLFSLVLALNLIHFVIKAVRQ